VKNILALTHGTLFQGTSGDSLANCSLILSILVKVDIEVTLSFSELSFVNQWLVETWVTKVRPANTFFCFNQLQLKTSSDSDDADDIGSPRKFR
jgi:hypothetical protein